MTSVQEQINAQLDALSDASKRLSDGVAKGARPRSTDQFRTPLQTPYGWTCSCGVFVPYGLSHACAGVVGARQAAVPVGWQCPVCRRVWGPMVEGCAHCGGKP